jgi:hypothetical protein
MLSFNVSIFRYLRPYWRIAVATAHSSIVINVPIDLDSHGFIHTIVFCIMAKDLYTGCQPVFVPFSSVIDCAASYVSIGEEDARSVFKPTLVVRSSSGLMLVGHRDSKNPLLWYCR